MTHEQTRCASGPEGDPKSDRIKELLLDAIPLSAREREEFLTRACSGDSELRRHLDALLRAHDRAGLFLE